MVSDLEAARVKLLRYPGGDWGEEHTLSYAQLNEYTQMLIDTHSAGMIQAHLSSIVDTHGSAPALVDTSLADRANLAGRWVDYMNNLKSNIRINGLKNDPSHISHTHDAFRQVTLWTVGNEPDFAVKSYQLNPLTRKPYTAQEYAQAFIQFSLAMHQNDPAIQVFGPELSQFYGVDVGPRDAGGDLWMETFLTTVAQYEQQHRGLLYHLLDGVAFHRYQFQNALKAPAMLMSGSDEWNYLLPPLHALIKRDFGRDMPIAVTEVNTNPSDGVSPSYGQAALWWADTLGTLMNQQIDYVAFFSTTGVKFPYPLFDNGLQATPMMRVMQLFSHLQSNLVPLAIQRDPVSLYATQDDARQVVSLLFVNKSPDVQSAQIAPLQQFASMSPWPTLSVTLAPYSIVELTLRRGAQLNAGMTDTYSYSASNNTSVAKELLYAQCGHKTDELSSEVPC
jgi:hypothetical protein